METMALVIVVALAACIHAKLSPCQPGQKRFGDACYQLLAGTRSWFDGLHACAALQPAGSRMAVPDTADEYRFLLTAFAGDLGGAWFWLGCTDMAWEDKWVDPDGERRRHLPWAPGEPHFLFKNAEHCLTVAGQPNSLVNDQYCDWSYAVVCESPALPHVARARSYHSGDYFTVEYVYGQSFKCVAAMGSFLWSWMQQDESQCRVINLNLGEVNPTE